MQLPNCAGNRFDAMKMLRLRTSHEIITDNVPTSAETSTDMKATRARKGVKASIGFIFQFEL